jgi:K+-transporting ATPase ATPase A chain
MTLNGWLQIAFFLLAIAAATPVLGRFMTRVFNREHTWLDPMLRPIERLIYCFGSGTFTMPRSRA